MRQHISPALVVALCVTAACLPAAAQLADPQPLQLPPPSSLNGMVPLRPLVQEAILPGTAPVGTSIEPVAGVALSGPCAMPDVQPTDTVAVVVDAMRQRLPSCERDAPYLAQLGHLLLAQGRYLEAGDHLERALMFRPDLQAAQLDYAIALAGSGDALSSMGLIADLLKQPNLPPPLRQALLHEQELWNPRQWMRRVTATARVGHDSNIFGAPNLSSLVLTRPSGLEEVPIADGGYLARGGTYVRSDLQVELARDGGDGSRLDIVASARGRETPSVAHSSSVLGDLAGEFSRYGATNADGRALGYYVGAGASALYSQAGTAGTEGNIQTQPSTRYTATGISAGWAIRSQAPGSTESCRQRIGFEVQKRRYGSSPQLSGDYAGLSASMSCAGYADSQWLLAGRYGRDTPEDTVRAGGAQQQASMRFAGYVPMKRLLSLVAADVPGGLLADVEVARYRDANGYNILLDNNRRRQVDRLTSRIEYQLPVSASVQWSIGAEWVRQRASLVLFRNSSSGPYTSLRVIW